ncbi:hypothetical protein OUZ56_029008 [Daphnia magna]|uniref:Uncharacterized protein n=1 Tax=Daphnia magna TaxID=35525 RepID=A0ABR0B5L4_9CRUS|nr:hypothetical protein OUZ56_029008 [Daphnia magna]
MLKQEKPKVGGQFICFSFFAVRCINWNDIHFLDIIVHKTLMHYSYLEVISILKEERDLQCSAELVFILPVAEKGLNSRGSRGNCRKTGFENVEHGISERFYLTIRVKRSLIIYC